MKIARNLLFPHRSVSMHSIAEDMLFRQRTVDRGDLIGRESLVGSVDGDGCATVDPVFAGPHWQGTVPVPTISIAMTAADQDLSKPMDFQ